MSEEKKEVEKPLEAARKILEEEWYGQYQEEEEKEADELFEEKIQKINALVKSHYGDCRLKFFEEMDDVREQDALESEVSQKVDEFYNLEYIMYSDVNQRKFYDIINKEIEKECGVFGPEIGKDNNKYNDYIKCAAKVEQKFISPDDIQQFDTDNVEWTIETLDCMFDCFTIKEGVLDGMERCKSEFEDKRAKKWEVILDNALQQFN